MNTFHDKLKESLDFILTIEYQNLIEFLSKSESDIATTFAKAAIIVNKDKDHWIYDASLNVLSNLSISERYEYMINNDKKTDNIDTVSSTIISDGRAYLSSENIFNEILHKVINCTIQEK